VEAFQRMWELEQLCAHPDSLSEQLAYWRSLKTTDSEQAEVFREQLLPVARRQAVTPLSEQRWADALPRLDDLRELAGDEVLPLQVVTLLLAQQDEQARELYRASGLSFSPELEYLLGWRKELDEKLSPMALFLRFQTEVEGHRWEQADALARRLVQMPSGKPFLYLWLGWYHLSHGRHQRALPLWNKALSLLAPQDRVVWADLLFPELRGRLTYLEQVRWQVRRNFAELSANLIVVKKPPAASAMTESPVQWAPAFWSDLRSGRASVASQRFVTGYLTCLVRPAQLELDSLSSGRLPLAPFASSKKKR
jgi:tetratricopeptide (TPR) repeat protein